MTAKPDAQMLAILERVRAAPAVDLKIMPIAQARPISDAASMPWNEGAPACETRALTIPGAAGPLDGRMYLPPDADRRAMVVYIHGGGWTFGSIDTHDGLMRRLALAAGMPVLGMNYRLAPEHPFPAGLDDVLASIRFAEQGGAGFTPERIVLGGDSAGATLALSALLSGRDTGLPALAGAALFYGCYVPASDTASHRMFGGGDYLLTTANMKWYWGNYLGAGTAGPALATGLGADLAGLPPLYLCAAGLDPLCDDTLLLAAALATAGVTFRCDYVPGVVHGCLRMARDLDAARDVFASASHCLRQWAHQ